MRTATATALFLALAVGPSCASWVTPRVQLQDSLDVLRRQSVAWNEGDIDGFLDGYRRSGDTVFVSNGDRTVGFEKVASRFRSRYGSSSETMGRLAFDEIDLLPLCQDSVAVNGRFILDASDGTRSWGRFTVILRRYEDVGWKIVHDHTSTPVETPPEPRGF